MSKIGRELILSMEEALAHAQKRKSGVRIRKVKISPVDVRKARLALKMTQEEFAAVLGTSPSGLRKWEQGVREPSGAARTLIRVIEKAPETVKLALEA